jgi:hypothetical protein
MDRRPNDPRLPSLGERLRLFGVKAERRDLRLGLRGKLGLGLGLLALLMLLLLLQPLRLL